MSSGGGPNSAMYASSTWLSRRLSVRSGGCRRGERSVSAWLTIASEDLAPNLAALQGGVAPLFPIAAAPDCPDKGEKGRCRDGAAGLCDGRIPWGVAARRFGRAARQQAWRASPWRAGPPARNATYGPGMARPTVRSFRIRAGAIGRSVPSLGPELSMEAFLVSFTTVAIAE